MLGMAANIPLGIWREHMRKFSLSWFIVVHAAVPFIAILRNSFLVPKTTMAFTIAASILILMGINLVKMQLFMSGRILLLPKRHRNKVFKNTKALLQGLTTTTIWTPSPNQLDNLSYDLPLDFDPIFFSGGLDDMGQENDLPSQMPGYYPTISS